MHPLRCVFFFFFFYFFLLFIYYPLNACLYRILPFYLVHSSIESGVHCAQCKSIFTIANYSHTHIHWKICDTLMHIQQKKKKNETIQLEKLVSNRQPSHKHIKNEMAIDKRHQNELYLLSLLVLFDLFGFSFV